MSSSAESACPSCGGEIPASSPNGVCPKCAFDTENLETLDIGPSFDPSAHPSSATASTRDSGASRIPKQIGPYRILSQLGEGGMGRVYLAEQREPVRRRVALKLIKPGMDSKEILARFEAERQAVALMDHPSIARVYDAGTTDAGLPFFVMELVEGKPVTTFCDDAKLSLKKRLHLFQQICEGIQHAHQKGIIHRDIKPSNILVVKDEKGEPVPKIIDFGVAKALGPGLTEATLFTMAGQVIGTPQYMSPEQANLGAHDIDTRADIYSLGVLLYELLTGRTPLEMSDMQKVGLDAMLRTIREVDAPRPSTKLSSLEQNTKSNVAENLKIPPSKLHQSLRGDLDWIVMKALEKERQRRYETANAFALDVDRFLKDQPVLASPPSAAYRFRKFAKRNKALILAGAAITTVLMAGIATTTWKAREAMEEQARAEAASEDAEKLVQFMLHDLRSKLEGVGKLELMNGVESAVGDYYKSAPGTGRTEDSLSRQATALSSAAQTLKFQGKSQEATASIQEAIQGWRELIESFPDSERYRFDLANSLYLLYSLLLEKGELLQADQSLGEALSAIESVPESNLEHFGAYVYSKILRSRAEAAINRFGDPEGARALAYDALEFALRANQGGDIASHYRLALAHSLALSSQVGTDTAPLWKTYNRPGAFNQIIDKLVAENPGDMRGKSNLLDTLSQTASLNNEDTIAKGLALGEELTAHDPTNLDWQLKAASMELAVAERFYSAFRYQKADTYYFRVEKRLGDLLETGKDSRRVRLLQAHLYSSIGLSAKFQGKPDEAVEYQRKSASILRQLHEADPNDIQVLSKLGLTLSRLSGHLEDGTPEELSIMEEAFEYSEKAYRIAPGYQYTDGTHYWTTSGLSAIHLRHGNYDEATRYNELSMDIFNSDPLKEKRRFNYKSLMRRGQISIAQGDRETAADTYGQIVSGWMEEIEAKPEVGDHGWRATQLSTAASRMLGNSKPDDSDREDTARKALSSALTELEQMHSDYDKIPFAIERTRSLMNRFADLARARKDKEDFRSLTNLGVALCTTWAGKTKDEAKRAKLLRSIAFDLQLKERQAKNLNWTPLLSSTTASALLKEWNSRPLPTELLAEKEPDIFYIHWIASGALAEHQAAEGKQVDAKQTLDEAEASLEADWASMNELGKYPVTFAKSFRKFAEIRSRIEDDSGAIESFQKAIALCAERIEAANSDVNEFSTVLIDSAHWCLSLMQKNGKGEAERLPLRQLQVEAAFKRYEREEKGTVRPPIVGLANLADTQNKLNNTEAAKTHYLHAVELYESLSDSEVRALPNFYVQHAAQSFDALGSFATKDKSWEEAETYFRKAMATWKLFNSYPETGKNLAEIRTTYRLAHLYGQSGRKDDPQRWRWYEEVKSALSPLEDKGELPANVNWVLRSTREILESRVRTAGEPAPE